MRKREILFFVIFYSLVLVIGVSITLDLKNIYNDDAVNLVKVYPSEFTDGRHDLSYRFLSQEEVGTNRFSAMIPKTRLASISDDQLTILIYQLCGQGYQVKFNDTVIGQLGDFRSGQSNIWNSIGAFHISREMVKEENELVIEDYSLYNTGTSTPVVIADPDAARSIINRFDFLVEKANVFFIGVLFLAAVIIFLLYLITQCERTAYLYFALGLLTIAGFSLDYTPINQLPCSYLAYKKTIILMLYLSLYFFSMAVYKYFGSPLNKYLAWFSITGIVLIMLVSGDMLTFKRYYDVYNFLIIVNVLSWLYVTAKQFRRSFEAKVFVVGFVFMLIYCAYDVWVTMFANVGDCSTPVFYISAASIVPLILVFNDFKEKNRLISHESREREKAYRKSITDEITALFNRNYAISIMGSLKHPYSVILMDIDEFKAINDNHGHRAGDLIIRRVADRLRTSFRETDLVCRYGGDEFLIILPDCSPDKYQGITQKLEKLRHFSVSIGDTEIQVSLSGGVYHVKGMEDIDSIIDKADQALYYSKHSGKGQVTVFCGDRPMS